MDGVTFFWGGWEPLVRILLVTTLGYLWLVALISRLGQRVLATMTPLDFVITVTLGSAFGRVITAKEVAVAEIVVAFAVLVALQWLAASGRARGIRGSRFFDAEPALLYHGGTVVEAAMRRHRLTERDLIGAVRKEGKGSLAEVEVIVLEPSGDFSVIGPDELGDASAIPAEADR